MSKIIAFLKPILLHGSEMLCNWFTFVLKCSEICQETHLKMTESVVHAHWSTAGCFLKEEIIRT